MTGNKIKKILKDKNINQKYICENSDISKSTMSRIVNNVTKSPKIDTLTKIANVLGVSINLLIGDDEYVGKKN